MIHLSCRRLAALLLLAGVAGAFIPGTARAETYHTCAGFIDSVPATITTQGVWCLRKDLSTSITSGNAITIATNNVTVDCNDFKLGGLAAGDGSEAIGIYTYDRQNLTVRNCNVRGFFHGIAVGGPFTSSGGSGHLVEDNRLDNNLAAGIFLRNASNSLVRRNQVYDTGGSLTADQIYGIYATEADVIDNTVAGVFAIDTGTTAAKTVYGILVPGRGFVIRNNRVRELELPPALSGDVVGIRADNWSSVDGNLVTSVGDHRGTAIRGRGPEGHLTICSNNVVAGFGQRFDTCKDNGGNAYP